ncbi:hypothetical protein JOF29_007902 [Kribbella aluminosa]|uniref:Uncharacterized protein n=1 Tax=Kribbella aluminosa TaxID=416017 RepID=A0ABS4UYV0_9ACTN|nr:hypothetical protein [Kribbella aluminosa]
MSRDVVRGGAGESWDAEFMDEQLTAAERAARGKAVR